jgi:hypothetical protein
MLCAWALVQPLSAQKPAKTPASAPTSPAKPAVAPEDARAARQAFEMGKRAETAGQLRVAFVQFVEAARLDSTQVDYAVARELARFRVAQNHADRAETAAAGGKLDEAILELRAALALDATFGVARERLRQLEAMTTQAVRFADEARSFPQLTPPRPGPQAFNFRGNTRGAYEEIAQKFGLTASFDDAMRIRQIHFRLPEVDLATALNVLGQQTATFWFPTGERAFFVSDDTEQRRREFAPVAIRTFLLPSSATTERMTELLRILRDILDIRLIQFDTRTRTLTIRETPDTLALATALIQELEQPRGEMMLEVTVAEIDRSKARTLGVLPPSTARLFTISPSDLQQLQGPQQSFGDLAALLQRIFGSNPGSGLGGLVPPLIAVGGGDTVGLVTLPGGTFSFKEAASVFRSTRRVFLRSEDSQPASFFIGERYPVNLSTLTTGTTDAFRTGAGSTIVPRRDFGAGDGPSAVLALDFDADGSLDLAVSNQAANTVSILLGSGDGTFSSPTDFATGAAPTSLTAADFNSDGNLDLLSSNEGDDTVTLLPGNGDGTFGPPVAFAVGILPRAVVAGNFNGDARVDLIVANHGSNTVSFLPGDATTTFGARTDIPAGNGPIALLTGDFDRDSRLDVAVANQNSNTVLILIGNGNGTFTATTPLAVGTGPRALFAANLNAGPEADLMVANETAGSVSVLLGNGDGTFGLATNFVTGGTPAAILASDFDGNGAVDIVTANRNTDSVSLLLGNGDGTLGLRAEINVGNGPAALALGNFNADGRLDLAIGNQNGDSVTIILNSAAGNAPPGFFTPQQPYPAFQFEDLGLKVKATPRMHLPDEVTLQLTVEIRSRTGEDFNGIPVISNRTLEQTVRLKEDETTVIGGILQGTETVGLSGWPGLASLPIAGRAVSQRDKDQREVELLLFLTPRRLRLAPRGDRTLSAGRETPGAAGLPAVRRPPNQP